MPRAKVLIRVPFSDVDLSTRVHFTAMLRYMEAAEHELMRSIGFPFTDLFEQFVAPRVHVSCDYRAALHYDDQVAVEAYVEKVGRTSWTMGFIMRSLQASQDANEEGTLVAEGRMTVVLVDRQMQRSTPSPDALRLALMHYQY
jgi:acyl-CoA thioester hydrolase